MQSLIGLSIADKNIHMPRVKNDMLLCVCLWHIYDDVTAVFCWYVLPCQILLPPIKRVVQIDNEKFYLLNYVLLMCTPTTTLNLPLQ